MFSSTSHRLWGKLCNCTDKINMLPFGRQGSNQAIEGAGALGFPLKGIGKYRITNRLEVIEMARGKRSFKDANLDESAGE